MTNEFRCGCGSRFARLQESESREPLDKDETIALLKQGIKDVATDTGHQIMDGAILRFLIHLGHKDVVDLYDSFGERWFS